MVLSTDVGSLFPRVKVEILDAGAFRSQSFSSLLYKNPSSEIFEREVVSAFIDKLKAGLDLPTYPQFRDMNKMFIDLMSSHNTIIPELLILKQNLSKIKDDAKLDKISIRVCISGPYTIASVIKTKKLSIVDITDNLCKILDNSLFKTKWGEVKLVCIDEPTFGFLNDSTLDYGSQGREVLKKAWESICKVASSQGIETSIHLHNTSDKLFWEIEHLNIIESHVGDSIYHLESTKKNLEETDKFLKASIAITRFDDLILEKVGGDLEKLAETWGDIKTEKVQPEIFLEDTVTIGKRLSKIINHFGSERIPYAGPECGVNGFPTYKCGLEYLRRVAEVIHNIYKHKQHISSEQ